MIQWVAALGIIIGRICLAYDFFWWGFFISALADVLWIIIGVRLRIWALASLDLVLLLADSLGVIRNMS